MKIELWEKTQFGHMHMDTLDVPDDFGDMYRMPVRQQPQVVTRADSYTTPESSLPQIREFRLQIDPLGRALGKLPRYIEI